MDNKAESTHHEEVYSVPQKKSGRVKNHCRRFWWAHCLVLIAVILIVLLPIIYVGVPNKAQHDINASTLEVTNQEVTSPNADGIHLKLDTVIRSGSQFHPTIDPFRAALSLKGQDPFFYINVPKSKSAGSTNVTVEEDIKLSSLDRFTDYTKTVLASDTFDVYMNGKTTLHLSGLPSMKVNYNKKVTMKGLNKLAGLGMTDLEILLDKSKILPDGSNLKGMVTVFNPSVMTLDLGNVTMNLAIDGKSMGFALIPNLILKPGNNKLPMQSTVDQLGIYGSVTDKYKNGVLPLDISGNSSVKDGVHLTYYEAALQSNPIRLNLNVTDALIAAGLSLPN